MYAGSTKAIAGSAAAAAGFVEEFRYLGHLMTADCRDDKDIKKKNLGGKMQLAICWSGSYHLHLLRH